jgi:hypothetical protein
MLQEASNTSETTTSLVSSNLKVIPNADALTKAIKGAKITMKALPGLSKMLTALNNLAVSLHTVCKHNTAERIYRRALQGRKKILRLNHIDTLTIMKGLAEILILRD